MNPRARLAWLLPALVAGGLVTFSGCGSTKTVNPGPDASGGSTDAGTGGVANTSGGGASAGGGIPLDPPAALPECSQPVAAGPCSDFVERYYYDSETKGCSPFMYGGCEGNDNNFPTRSACVDYCLGTKSCDCVEDAPDCDKTRCEQCPAELALAQDTECEAIGLHCSRERNSCDCVAGASGDGAWDCRIIP